MSYVTPARLKQFKELQDEYNQTQYAPLADYLTEHPAVEISSDDTESVSPKFGDTVTVVSSITKDTYGHITKISLKEVTIPDTITVGEGEDEVTVSVTDLLSTVLTLKQKVEELSQTVNFKASTNDEQEQLALVGDEALNVDEEKLVITTSQAVVNGETITFNSLGD